MFTTQEPKKPAHSATTAAKKHRSSSKPTFHRSSTPDLSPPSPKIQRSSEQPLNESTRTWIEPRFNPRTDTPAAEFTPVYRNHLVMKTTGYTPIESRLQTKLSVGAAGDIYEQEADRVAEQVVGMTPPGENRWVSLPAYVVSPHGSTPQMQRQPNQQSDTTGVPFSYSVSVNRMLNSDQLILEFIKQYRGVATDAEAAALRDKENWHWVSLPPPSVKQTDVDQGYILITVTDSSITPSTKTEKNKRRQYFKGLSPKDRAEINTEVDSQFWKKTQYRTGQKLGTSADDQRMAEYWKILRDELINSLSS